jgi:S-adenosylmethionine:tRNA ribosyltransferase-isomerase
MTAFMPNTVLPVTMMDSKLDSLVFDLPSELEASEPIEARGLRRDDVRLMVSWRADDAVEHTAFRNLPEVLQAGDVVVVNTSGTRKASLPVVRKDGTALRVHLSTQLPAEMWAVEIREPNEVATQPFYGAEAGEVFDLPGGGSVQLHAPYRAALRNDPEADVRLWVATLTLPFEVDTYLDIYGAPIRYGYVKNDWPADMYQTAYATEMGSSEMPSAGRAFTPEVITQLVARGVQVVPLILHTGVASLEADEPPYEEFYRVSAETARVVNDARKHGRRVIAVGTTVVRALETVTDEVGHVSPGEGWTTLVISPERPMRAVDGLLTGMHEPSATHLSMLQALAGLDHLRVTYEAALEERYLWHEFGDLHLILP